MEDTEDFKKKYQVKTDEESEEQISKQFEEAPEFRLYEEVRFKSKKFNNEDNELKQENKWKKFFAPKGLAKQAKAKAESLGKLSKRLGVRVAAILLAATVAGGVIGHVPTNKNEENKTIEQLMNQNVEVSRLGLNKQSVETLLKYNEFFENEQNPIPPTTDLMEMSKEIYNLTMSVTKQKLAMALGYSESDIELRYGLDNSDGRKVTQVRLHEKGADTSKVIYEDAGANLLSIPSQKTLPKEMCNIIWQLNDLSYLEQELENEKISDKNALKNLKKYFTNLQNFSTKELIMSKSGSLALINYDGIIKEDNQTYKSEEER